MYTMDNSMKIARFCHSFIKRYKTPHEALKAAQQTPAPNKLKSGKKALCKLIRTYIYFTEQA